MPIGSSPALMVLDASVFVAFVMRDEAAFHEQAKSVFKAIAEEKYHALVPVHFVLEVSNVILTAYRKRRINKEDFGHYLHLLERFPAEIESDVPLKPIAHFSHSHSLTMYDACYLELAVRRKATLLATFDAALQKAAKMENICVTM